jgi:hypothetical protein
MKFEEALTHINNGIKMRCVIWSNKNCYFKPPGCETESDHNTTNRLSLDDINNDWDFFEYKCMSFDEAIKECKDGKKIRRKCWDINQNREFESVKFTTGEVMADDWYVFVDDFEL